LLHSKDDVIGILSLFMGGPAELMAAFDLDAGPEPPNALSPEERWAAIGKLQSDLLALERIEAALLERADGALPRPEMSPLAYLGIEVVAVEVEAAVA
jgi:hypothetical protein